MVTCTKCGTKNEEDAKFCVNCGASLYPGERSEKQEDTCFGAERRMEEGCFGLPQGGAIAGIIFGAFIIIIGVSIGLGIDIGSVIGPSILVIIGVLIVAGTIYGLSRRRKG